MGTANGAERRGNGFFSQNWTSVGVAMSVRVRGIWGLDCLTASPILAQNVTDRRHKNGWSLSRGWPAEGRGEGKITCKYSGRAT